MGLGSGGWALSPSVRASAVARSAARWACCGVDGAAAGEVAVADWASFVGCDFETLDRAEGNMGFDSGGCALSDSVTASAAAKSAARWASWGVDGASGEAFGGNEGSAEGFGGILA